LCTILTPSKIMAAVSPFSCHQIVHKQLFLKEQIDIK
jgi:hypothetical protein